MKKLLPLILILTVVFLLAMFVSVGVLNKNGNDEQTYSDTTTSVGQSDQTLPDCIICDDHNDSMLVAEHIKCR